MRKIRKKLKTPLRPWDKDRIEEERKLLEKYGLRRKREIWKAESILRKYRRRARIISAKNDKEGEKILLDKLYKMGVLKTRDVDLGVVLGLKVNDILNRRLQTIVFEKDLANTALQARQLITHGHITVEEKKNIFPSYLVPRDIENKIEYYGNFSPEKAKPKKKKSQDELNEKPAEETSKEKTDKPEELKEKSEVKEEKVEASKKEKPAESESPKKEETTKTEKPQGE